MLLKWHKNPALAELVFIFIRSVLMWFSTWEYYWNEHQVILIDTYEWDQYFNQIRILRAGLKNPTYSLILFRFIFQAK